MSFPRPLNLGFPLLDLAEQPLHLSMLSLTFSNLQFQLANARRVPLLVGHEQLNRLLLSLDKASRVLGASGG